MSALEWLGRDARMALRGLARQPLFTVVAVLTLAIGSGATTAVFSVADGVLLKPLPYPDPDRLVAVWHDAPGAPSIAAMAGGLQISPSMLVTYRENSRSFEQIGLWQAGAASVTGVAEPEQVAAANVTGQLLPALGIKPLLGRWIAQQDEAPNGPAVVMLGYDYWQRRFGGDREVLGRQIVVAGRSREIVGVMPRGFRIADTAVDLIAPFPIDPSRLIPPPFCCNAIARLKPGVTIEQADADIERMLPIWIDRFPYQNGKSGRSVYLDTWKIRPALRPLKADVLGNVAAALWVVLATIGAVLVIACANVTNLLLVRGERRSQEVAVRAALGAGGWPIARALIVESLLLALAGGVVGVAIAYGALKLLLALAPTQLPRLDSIALDGRALAFTLVVTLVAGGLLGLAPALRAARGRIAFALRAGGGLRGASGGRAQHRTQNALVVGQVALALVLLVSSGLMIRSFAALRAIEPGFADAGAVETFRLAFFPQLVPDARDVEREQHAILDAIEALPGVTSAALTNSLPLEGVVTNWDGIDVEGQSSADQIQSLRTYVGISPDYFRTLGTRLVAGRDLSWSDLEDPRPVAIVSENLARELWGSAAAALGKRIRAIGGGPWRDVIGVAEDVRSRNLEQGPPATVYWPAFMKDFYLNAPSYVERFVAIAVHSARAGAPALQHELERAVWSVNPDLPLAGVGTMQDLYDRSLARTSFTLVMLALAAGAALVLGVVGLYGTIAYAVSQRRREIAIRLALGSPRSRVTRTFVRYGAGLAALGVAIGLVAAAAVTRLMGALLYDVRSIDPLTYAAVATVLTLVAALASWLPARRAAAVDPAEALVSE